MTRSLILALCLITTSIVSNASAQGLIWSLPEDGTWVRFEGTYKQSEARSESSDGPLDLEWAQHVTIKSVGKEQADYKGEKTACRWVEIKVQTGRIDQGAIDTGTSGERIYKVLIPEKAIIGSFKDAEGLPVTHLPIVKGFRKTDGKSPQPKPITSGVLQVYPVIALLRDYKELEESPGTENLQVGADAVEVKEYKGNLEQESPVQRYAHETKFYRSKQVPFGLARWLVTITQEQKAEAEPRSAFKKVSDIRIEMATREVGADAKSELITDAAPAEAPAPAAAEAAEKQ